MSNLGSLICPCKNLGYPEEMPKNLRKSEVFLQDFLSHLLKATKCPEVITNI